MGPNGFTIGGGNFGPKALRGETSKTPLRSRGFWTFPEPLGVAGRGAGPQFRPNNGPKPGAEPEGVSRRKVEPVRGGLTGRCQGMGGTGNAVAGGRA